MKKSVSFYSPKKILNINKYSDGGWFWVKYSAQPYLGCAYGCLYCYEWDRKYTPYYNPAAFDRLIKVKEKGAELFAMELAAQPVDLIGLGDWQPVESKYRVARAMLKVANDLGFPVFINEKSPLILQDLNLLRTINRRNYANVGFSIITTQDDETLRIFEPKTPSIESRFEAMAKISDNGIMTGTVFMPVLPFIYDNEQNIKAVVKKTRQAGGKYLLDGGLTLHGFCQEKYYTALKKFDPDLIGKYDELYQDSSKLQNYYRTVHQLVKKYCQQYRIANTIPRPINHFPQASRINKLIAEKMYLKARDYQLQGEPDYRVLAYLKVAREIDQIDYDILTLYQKDGIDGLKQIAGVGDKIALVLEAILSDFK